MSGLRVILVGVIAFGLLSIVIPLFSQSLEIVGWGRDNYGQITDIPEGSDFVSIASGGDHSVAIRQDGSLVAWGYNVYGECNVPAGFDFVKVSVGRNHSIALKEDNTIVAWGRDWNDVLAVPAGNDFIDISAGYQHNLALREDGSIVGWGNNNYGQISVPYGNDFVAVEAGGFHSVALRENGTITAWGRDWNGVLNVPGGNDLIAISAGYYQSIALRDNGSVVVWGSDDDDQVSHTPTTSDFIAISATGNAHCMALREDGSVIAWGAGEEGEDGLWDHGQSIYPDGNDFVAIAAGRLHSLALVMTEPPSEYTLNIGIEGEGTTDPEPGEHIYDVGVEVTITAYPVDGWEFDRWVINGDDVFENPHNITMNSNITAIAHFVPIEYSLTIEVEGEGTTNPEPGEYVYLAGEEVEITALADEHWYFHMWMIDDDSIFENPYSVIMDDDITITAHFLPLPPPENLLALAGDSVVWLEWEYPDLPVFLDNDTFSFTDTQKDTRGEERQDFQGFKIYRDGTQLNTELLVDNEYEDSDVENGVSYLYYVTAVYEEGESLPSNEIEATPEELLLPPPTGLEVEMVEDTVTLSWMEPEYDDLILNGYNAYRDNVLINTEPIEETTYPDEGFVPDPGVVYEYYVTAIYLDGESEPSEIVEFMITAVEEDIISISTTLRGNHPNPFNPRTEITFSLAEPGPVRIDIFNSRGQKIRQLTDSYYDRGEHRLIWDGTDDNNQRAGSGIYFYRMLSNDYQEARKMIMLK